MTRPIRLISFLVSPIGLAAALAACGSGGGSAPTTPTVPPPAPAVRTVIDQGSYSGLPARTLLVVPFITAASGTIDATVDWTFPSNTIYVYVSRGTCALEQINADQCPFVAVSEAATPKPRVIRVPGASPGAYTLYIGNVGPSEESVSFQIGLTTGGSVASFSGLGRADARHAGEFVRAVSPR